jgi:hypothetical protein
MVFFATSFHHNLVQTGTCFDQTMAQTDVFNSQLVIPLCAFAPLLLLRFNKEERRECE